MSATLADGRLAMPAEQMHPRIIHTLKKRFRVKEDRLLIEGQDQWNSLAREVIKQAPGLRQPRLTVTVAELVQEWQKELADFVDGSGDQHLKNQRAEMLREAPEQLKRSLQELCAEGVFHQGHDWVCPRCAYRNWAALDALKASLDCQVCHRSQAAPVDLQFRFRLNDFLATCIREHDTVSVVWALSTFQQDHRHPPLIFAPQTALFRQYGAEESREIDLLCIVNGQVIVGEVKPSLSDIGTEEISTLIEVAQELSADAIFIGALEGNERNLASKEGTLRSKLPERVGVIARVRGDPEREPFLP